jgi:hypothetical protein
MEVIMIGNDLFSFSLGLQWFGGATCVCFALLCFTKEDKHLRPDVRVAQGAYLGRASGYLCPEVLACHDRK